jgi:hypothetical protein
VHTRQSSTQNNKYQVSHRYSYFSWWWAYSRPKHVEKRNEHTKKSCAPSWLYLQDYTAVSFGILHSVRKYEMWFDVVWFGLFVQPLSLTCNIGHVNYRLQFIYYNTTYNIWTSTQCNIINNNTKFKDQLEVEFVTTSRFMGIYINISNS